MKKTVLLIGVLIALPIGIAQAGDVTELYEKSCVKCHGADGKGDTKMGKKVGVKDMTDAKVQGEFTDAKATAAIKEGLKDKEGKIQMKPVEGATDEDIKGLVAKIRAFKK